MEWHHNYNSRSFHLNKLMSFLSLPANDEILEDRLLAYLSDEANLPVSLSNIVQDIKTKGFSVIPSLLTQEECQSSLELLWDFVEDVSGGIIHRNDPDPRNWYPKSELVPLFDDTTSSLSQLPLAGENVSPSSPCHDPYLRQEEWNNTEDPWPYTLHHSRNDTFQSLGAGFLLGHCRCLLAERLFQPLFGGLRELHCSKEGFTFARPSLIPQPYPSSGDPQTQWQWTRRRGIEEHDNLVLKSQGEQYTQSHVLKGLHTIQAAVAFTDQSEECQDGHFLCWPYTHSHVHQLLTENQGHTSPIQLNDDQLYQLESMDVTRYGIHAACRPTHVYVKAGDVIIWRSDLVHSVIGPGSASRRFTAMGYFSMQPACWTPNYPQIFPDKVNAYKWGMTGDHRSFVESWQVHNHWTERKQNSGNLSSSSSMKRTSHIDTHLISSDISGLSYSIRPYNFANGIGILQRPFYRYGPPQISVPLAKLYGLIPYDSPDMAEEIKRATIRGVRFIDYDKEEVDKFPGSRIVHQNNLPRRNIMCDVLMQKLIMNDGSLLYGQEKYLGGMCSPCGNYIYGCPGHAHRVLCVNTKTNAMNFIGPSFPGKYKWLRGVEIPASVMADENEYPLGCCLALPSNATCVLKINPKTNEVTTFGELTEDCGWLYHGGNLLSDGFVYAIPANASRVLKIDPRENTIELVGPTFPGKQKWYGGIVGCDGCLYGIPQNFSGILKINPRDQTFTILSSDRITEGDWKWHGGLSIHDGRYIVGFPNNADSILMIDVLHQHVFTVHSPLLESGRHRIPQDGRYKYLGGAVSQDGRYTYFFPCDAERVLRMDNDTFELTLIGPLLLEGENKFQNGFLGRDGCLYGIPQRACGILRIIPASVIRQRYRNRMMVYEKLEDVVDHVDVMYCGEDMVPIKDKFEGGVMDLDGSMYCIPMQAKALIKITPSIY